MELNLKCLSFGKSILQPMTIINNNNNKSPLLLPNKSPIIKNDTSPTISIKSSSIEDDHIGTPLIGLTPGSNLNIISKSLSNDYFLSKKKPPPVPIKKEQKKDIYVTALYDYISTNIGDLSLKEGDCIKIIKKSDSINDWWIGELLKSGEKGNFPANYVE